MKKTILTFAVLALALVVLPSAYGLTLADTDVEDPVAPGENVEVVVTVENRDTTDNVEDIRWEAVIVDPVSGEEIGDRTEESASWRLRHADLRGSTVRATEKEFTISLKVPADTEEGDYFVAFLVEGEWELDGGRVDVTDFVEFEVEREEHSLHVSGLRASDKVEAGETLNLAVDLLNNGNNEEPGVTLTAAARRLDASTEVTLLSPLAESAGRTVYLAFDIPENADAGLYVVTVTAESDYTETSETLTFEVTEAEAEEELVPATPQTTEVSASLTQGRASVVSIEVSNSGSTDRTYALSVGGTRDWAESARVDPATITVEAGETETVNVHLVPTAEGSHTATLFVKEGGNIVSFVNINADVAAGEETTVSGARTVNATEAASWLFVALVVILVVVAVVWQLTRRQGGEGKTSVYY